MVSAVKKSNGQHKGILYVKIVFLIIHTRHTNTTAAQFTSILGRFCLDICIYRRYGAKTYIYMLYGSHKNFKYSCNTLHKESNSTCH